jgi:hypothetical protein
MIKKSLPILNICGLGTLGLIWIFAMTSSPPSTAQQGDVLDEQTLTNIAIGAAKIYGLKSEPEILISDYILAREFGPTMAGSDVQREPDMLVYVLSLRGEFEPGKAGGLMVVLPGQTEPTANTFAPEGFTFAINARTGFIMFERTAPETDLASMTTDLDRIAYDMMSREEWEPIVDTEPVNEPVPTVFPWTVTQIAPESTAALLPLPPSS